MAENLLSLKKRLNTITSIRKITKAMKLIASSRYNVLKNMFEANKEYVSSMKKAMLICSNFIDLEDETKLPSCMKENIDANGVLYIFVSSTLGLSGAYYSALSKLANTLLNKESDVIFIGEKGYREFKDKINNSYIDYLHLLDNISFNKVNLFRHYLDNLYKVNKYKEIKIIYTKYISSFETKAIVESVLPFKVNESYKEEKVPIFDNDPAEVADLIIPHYLDALLYHYFLESSLSEQTCRKNSMENATKKSDDLIKELTLTYNKIRQQNITSEITQIISGSTTTINF